MPDYNQFLNGKDRPTLASNWQWNATYSLYECFTCGAFMPRNGSTKQHDNFHAAYTYVRGNNMSNVLWCDEGEHAFKAEEPGSANYTAQQYDENGVPQTVQMHACRTHNPFRKQYEERELKVLTDRAARELNED